jgi:hypothetical protein
MIVGDAAPSVASQSQGGGSVAEGSTPARGRELASRRFDALRGQGRVLVVVQEWRRATEYLDVA